MLTHTWAQRVERALLDAPPLRTQLHGGLVVFAGLSQVLSVLWRTALGG